MLKEFGPSFSRGGDMAMDVLAGAPIKELQQIGREADEEAKGPKGFEVGYELFGINGKMLGHGEPIRVKQGERVLFHVLNASAGEIRSLALPGHVFQDRRARRQSGADASGRAGAVARHRRAHLRHRRNEPSRRVGDGRSRRRRPAARHGHRRRIRGCRRASRNGSSRSRSAGITRNSARPMLRQLPPDETIEMTIVKHNAALDGFNQWTLNGEAFSMETMKPMYTVHEGRRYRLKFRNASDDIHPLHLHRHSFELTRIGGKPTAGVIKDVVMLGGFQELEFDFVADNPGLTLFHCHQQLHMDFGFMALFKYA